jgi:DNA (cytosine-5)-methyltransferase 1
MKTYKVLALGEHRGTPRLWLQGRFPANAGFKPGTRFEVERGERHIALKVADDGTYLVSRKERGEKVDPVIDLNSQEVLGIFNGLSALRVVMRENEIMVMPLESELRARARAERLKQRLESGAPLEVGALAFGAGVLDNVLHGAFEEEGVPTHLAFANEIREDLLEQAVEVNRVIEPDTKVLCAPMQEVAFDERAMRQIPQVDILTAGLPCSGASVAGRAKRKLEQMEDHPLVGHLVAPAIAIIARLNPAVFTLENVTSYAGTASAAILRHQLRDLGYVVHERKFLATEFGDLEARERWCMVAVTKGIDLDLDEVLPAPFAVRTLNDILEPLEAVADRWSEMQGLKDKEVRDLEAGKNFKMQVYDGGESSIGTLTKGLAKNRSTDPKIRHATNPDLLRVPTVREHARAKGVDERLVEGLTFTVGHEVLGQGICAAPFRALFRYLARELRASTAKLNKRVFNQFKHEQESLLVAA